MKLRKRKRHNIYEYFPLDNALIHFSSARMYRIIKNWQKKTANEDALIKSSIRFDKKNGTVLTWDLPRNRSGSPFGSFSFAICRGSGIFLAGILRDTLKNNRRKLTAAQCDAVFTRQERKRDMPRGKKVGTSGMRRSMCRCLAPGNPRLLGFLPTPLNAEYARVALLTGAPFGRRFFVMRLIKAATWGGVERERWTSFCA